MANSNNNFNLIQSYPIFEPNQVLTDKQLNGVVEYLEQQDRLTRVCLLGMGIVCGLEAAWDDERQGVHISPGHGVTSEGYLVKVAPPILTHFRLREVPANWFGQEGSTTIQGVSDLITEPEFEEDDVFQLTKANLNGKVLAIALECLQHDDDGLCGNDCDEKGKALNFIVHYMLLSQSDAEAILKSTYDPQGNHAGGIFNSMEELFYYKFFTAHPFVERFGYTAGENGTAARLNTIVNYQIFQERYRGILVPLCERIDQALKNVHKVFSPVFTPGMVGHAALSLNPIVKNKITGTYHRFEVQYLYDHLCDLVHGYLEFMEAVFDLIADCPTDTHRFPKHLWLRKFDENGTPEDSPLTLYRTPYTQPPIYNGNRSRQAEARTLYQRLQILTQAYQTPNFTAGHETKATPGKSDEYPLSQRAVPYYYGENGDLLNHWNPRRKRINRPGQVYAYHRTSVPPYHDPLVFQMEGSNFYRIEGHIGKDFNTVLTELSDLRQQYNLSFEVMALKIGEEFNEELFQFECEDFECEKRAHQRQYNQLRDTLKQQLFQFATTGFAKPLLDTLIERLDEFDYVTFSAAYDIFNLQTQQSLQTPKTPFGEVSECFEDLNNRMEEVKKKHLFHYFAQAHPGLEHKGGVPIGGTFIVAYTEPAVAGQEIEALIAHIDGLSLPPEEKRLRKEIARQTRPVVADFYLPYSCISCCPPICFVAARPRPILLVSPTVFCEGDTSARVLTITTHLGGGVLTGPGYKFEEGQHLFVPSESGVQEGTVPLKYFIDGGEAVVHLTIVKRPNASFQVVGADGNSITKICQDGGLLSLLPNLQEGTFTAWADATELQDVIGTDDNNTVTFDPAAVPLLDGQPLKVEIRYAVEGNFCDNLFSHELTVLPVPDAAFNFAGGVAEICKEDGPIQLLPAVQGGIFTAHINNSGPINGATLEDLGKWSFNPEAIPLEAGDSVVVTIRHKIVSDGGCGNAAERLLTVSSSPKINIKIPLSACQNAGAVPLAASVPGGTFTAQVASGTTPSGLVVGNQLFPHLITSQTAVQVRVFYTVEIGPCTTQAQQTISILPVPSANFEAVFEPLPHQGDDVVTVQQVSVRVFNIQPAGGQQYIWESTPAPLQPIPVMTDNKEFLIVYPPSEGGMGAISLKLTVRSGGCQSPAVEKTVLPVINFFELKGVIEGSGGMDEVSSRLLFNGAIIQQEVIKSDLFNIRAYPLPSVVGKVHFELSGPVSTNSTSDDLFGGYDMVENGGLAVQVGKYELKATPVTQAGMAGKTSAIRFSIVEGSESERFEPARPASMTEEAITFLRRRDSSYRSKIKALETDTGLSQTEGFKKTEGFLSFQNGLEDFNKRYLQTVEALLKNAQTARKVSLRRNNLLQLMAVATQHFMDRQVVASAARAPQSALDTVASQLTAMKKTGLDAKALKKDWDGDSLKKQLKAPAVDAFNKILK